MRVGVEVGGTFTDLVVVRDGAVDIAKVPSTPQQPDVGALAAISAAGIGLGAITDLVHGSTVATNAVLERKGGRVGVFVTAGTRDLFGLQRQDRTAIYDLKYRKPQPVVVRDDICEIDERLAPDGSVVVALTSGTTLPWLTLSKTTSISRALTSSGFTAASYSAGRLFCGRLRRTAPFSTRRL